METFGFQEYYAAMNKLQFSEADKIVNSAMKAGGSQAAKYFKQVAPHKNYKKIIKAKFKQGRDYAFMNVGLFNANITMDELGWPKTKGNIKRLWSIAYWLNYGTLKNRDKSHQFRYPIKPSLRKVHNNRGVVAKNWFDPASEQAATLYQTELEKVSKKKFEELYGK